MTVKKIIKNEKIAQKQDALSQDDSQSLSAREYLDTRDAAIEADKAALGSRRSSFRRPRDYSNGTATQYVFDRRNKYGTGSLITYLKTEKGSGRVVYFVEDEAITTCAIKGFKLHGDEVTCDPTHRVVRRWDNGKIVPRMKQPKRALVNPRKDLSR